MPDISPITGLIYASDFILTVITLISYLNAPGTLQRHSRGTVRRRARGVQSWVRGRGGLRGRMICRHGDFASGDGGRGARDTAEELCRMTGPGPLHSEYLSPAKWPVPPFPGSVVGEREVGGVQGHLSLLFILWTRPGPGMQDPS
ncbi:hypothetical protein DPEC_G00345890 [Dallia pectoralis]|uniref:Uncharacterized protein n=1 Tax=Dallia pectoralis TaxID=75939 RepID=A0ACC2F3N7_DALPE|nr:hypothetical protein DPEC_G00345890 [Dallia pectoralis]